jgi:hypothetical protein
MLRSSRLAIAPALCEQAGECHRPQAAHLRRRAGTFRPQADESLQRGADLGIGRERAHLILPKVQVTPCKLVEIGPVTHRGAV